MQSRTEVCGAGDFDILKRLAARRLIDAMRMMIPGESCTSSGDAPSTSKDVSCATPDDPLRGWQSKGRRHVRETPGLAAPGPDAVCMGPMVNWRYSSHTRQAAYQVNLDNRQVPSAPMRTETECLSRVAKEEASCRRSCDMPLVRFLVRVPSNP